MQVVVHKDSTSLHAASTEELKVLKASIAEVGAVARNLNQIARAMNLSERTSGPDAVQLSKIARRELVHAQHDLIMFEVNFQHLVRLATT